MPCGTDGYDLGPRRFQRAIRTAHRQKRCEWVVAAAPAWAPTPTGSISKVHQGVAAWVGRRRAPGSVEAGLGSELGSELGFRLMVWA